MTVYVFIYLGFTTASLKHRSDKKCGINVVSPTKKYIISTIVQLILILKTNKKSYGFLTRIWWDNSEQFYRAL